MEKKKLLKLSVRAANNYLPSTLFPFEWMKHFFIVFQMALFPHTVPYLGKINKPEK